MSTVMNNDRNCFGINEMGASDKQLSHSMHHFSSKP